MSYVKTSFTAKMANSFDVQLQQSLVELNNQQLLRTLPAPKEGLISFCDNDYLGLRNDERIRQFLQKYETGSGASRLVSGNHPLYSQLEAELAAMKGCQAALIFSSGFAMNHSLIPALTDKGDMILADKLCHASLIDGIRASQASFKRFAHNDMLSLKRLLEANRGNCKQLFIITESIFSMDGDSAPIEELLTLAEQYDCQLLVDDAHGLGFNLLPAHPRLIQLGTLSKAAGSLGGYVCGSQLMVDYLTNHCRSFIYSTALPPVVLAASLKALQLMQQEPQRAKQAMAHAQHFCTQMDLATPDSPIVPYIVGESAAAVEMASALEGLGFHVVAIRPPTVPKGTARLRFSFSARHSDEQVAALISAMKEIS